MSDFNKDSIFIVASMPVGGGEAKEGSELSKAFASSLGHAGVKADVISVIDKKTRFDKNEAHGFTFVMRESADNEQLQRVFNVLSEVYKSVFFVAPMDNGTVAAATFTKKVKDSAAMIGAATLNHF